MQIYFVRHGQTEWNLLGKMQGNTDIPLNDIGREQARRTAEKLKHIPIDAIYCSPLIRAYETAEIINQNWKLPLFVDERLRERNFGEYEGNASADLDYRKLWSLSDVPPFQGAEDTNAFYRRVEGFLDELIAAGKYNTVLMVAHGGVSIPYYCYFHGYQLTDFSSVLLGNCEVACMEGKKYDLKQRG